MPEVIQCTVTVVMSTFLKVLGILCGVMLAVAGILALAGGGTFASPLWSFYTPSNSIAATDSGWTNPRLNPVYRQESMRFSWSTSGARRLRQTSAAYVPLGSDGFDSGSLRTSGSLTVRANRFAANTPVYFCLTAVDNNDVCSLNRTYYVMRNPGIFDNRNYFDARNIRFTYVILSIFFIIFGIVMILGELHLSFITTKFTFFYSSFVKGVIYLTLGVQILAVANIFGLATAILFFITGILNMVYGRNYIVRYHWRDVHHRGTATIVTRREYL